MSITNYLRAAFVMVVIPTFAEATVISGGWTVLDNQMANDAQGTFSKTGGTFVNSAADGGPWDNGSFYQQVVNGSATATATWTFINLPAGLYNVAASWGENSNRSPDAPYAIGGGSPILIDQALSPSGGPVLQDSLFASIPFSILQNNYAHAGGNLVVTVTNLSSTTQTRFVMADAIAIQSVPEPTAGLLAGLGTIALSVFVRATRRRRS
jgi:hypothetical protein